MQSALRFRLAVASLALAASPAVSPAAEKVEVRLDADSLEVLSGGAVALDYRTISENGFKAYVAGLHLPGGINPFRDSPFDHVHHHALMLAFDVNDVAFWGVEDKNCGRQVHRRFADLAGPDAAGRVSFTDLVEWVAPEAPDAPAAKAVAGKTLLVEERRLAIRPAERGAPQVLDWVSTIAPAAGAGSARLTGQEYHGLGARFVVPMDKGGRFLDADGRTGVAGTNAKRSRWCSYAASPEPGTKVTVCMFDDPKNPRAPADWFTMDSSFAYMTLTMGLDAEPLVVGQGEKLHLHYGVAVFEGQAEAPAIEATYRNWLEGSR